MMGQSNISIPNSAVQAIARPDGWLVWQAGSVRVGIVGIIAYSMYS